MPRLFIGLEVPESISTRLSLLRAGLPGARWVDPSDYHVTLRFIGDIDRRLANEVDEELADLYGEPIRVRITGLGVFGGDKPHTLYAAIEPSRPLVGLQADSERRLRRLGLPPEQRKFVPHVTLAGSAALPRSISRIISRLTAIWLGWNSQPTSSRFSPPATWWAVGPISWKRPIRSTEEALHDQKLLRPQPARPRSNRFRTGITTKRARRLPGASASGFRRGLRLHGRSCA